MAPFDFKICKQLFCCELTSIATREYISPNRHFLKAIPIFLGFL